MPVRAAVIHAQGMFDPHLLRRYAVCVSNRIDLPVSQREHAAIERGETSDHIRKNSEWYDIWKRESFAPGSLTQFIGRFTYILFPPQVRHIREEKHFVPWHQDAGYIALQAEERRHRKILTCFIPLDTYPMRHTTIQFKPGENEVLEHKPLNGFGAGFETANIGWHYNLALGDALVFGDLVPHRTFCPRGAVLERKSLEFRLIDPEDALPGRDYFNILTGEFV